MKDRLFLMQPGFSTPAGKGPFYCGHCVPVEGFLALFPQVSEAIEVERVAFARPRPAIVELLGEERQSVPVLVLANADAAGDLPVQRANGHVFIDDEKLIRHYLSGKLGLPVAS